MPSLSRFQTSPDGLRLAPVDAPDFQPQLENWYQGQALVLEPEVRYQTWLGFGVTGDWDTTEDIGVLTAGIETAVAELSEKVALPG